MVLSSERESQLMEKNMPNIYRSIDNFLARCNQDNGVPLPYEDCVQEVAIAYLQYIRRCETEDQLKIFPWYDAIHALSEYVLRCQPLSVPVSTKGFRKTLRTIPTTVSYETLVTNGLEVDGMSQTWVPDKETELDFDTFMSAQSPHVQRIVSMKLYGMPVRKIAGQCGVGKSSVNNKILRLKKQYDQFNEEEPENE